MAKFEVGFYLKAVVNVEAEDADEALEKSDAMTLNFNFTSPDDPEAYFEYVESLGPDVDEINQEVESVNLTTPLFEGDCV